jgi:putative FmdB family regulatory protein
MPAYDFRCMNCSEETTLHYKSISAYAEATPQCPHCGSEDLERIIKRVTVQGTKTHDFASMDSQQMLSVLESGDKKAVETMYKQVGAKPAPDVRASDTPKANAPKADDKKKT